MAKPVLHPSVAERIGRYAGRAWRGGVRGQKRLALWLASKGAPAPLASALSMLAAIFALGVVAHVAFWLALLLAIAVAIAWGASKMVQSTQEKQDSEWRQGVEGFGYYENGIRTDYGRVFESEDDR